MKTSMNNKSRFLIMILLTLIFWTSITAQISAPADALIGQCSLGDASYGWSKMTRASVYLIAVDGNKMGIPRSNLQFLVCLKVYDLTKTQLPATNQKYKAKGEIVLNSNLKEDFTITSLPLGTVNIDYQGAGKYSYLYFVTDDFIDDVIETSFLFEKYDRPLSSVFYYTDKGEKVTFTIKPDEELYQNYKNLKRKIIKYWGMPEEMINDF